MSWNIFMDSLPEVARSQPQLVLGRLPELLSPSDARPILQQLRERYGFGDLPHIPGFEYDPRSGILSYPGDPNMEPIAASIHPLTREIICLYPHDIICIAPEPDPTSDQPRPIHVTRID